SRPVRCLRDRLETAVRDGARAEDRLLRRRGGGSGFFGVIMTEAMKAHRGHEDGHGYGCSEDSRAERSRRDAAQHARQQLVARPGLAVLAQRPFVGRAAGDVVEQHRVQALARPRFQTVEVQYVEHRLSSWRRLSFQLRMPRVYPPALLNTECSTS